VVSVLQEIEQEKKVSFELFLTGHSLGGWLAQTTAFTTEHLVKDEGTFLKKVKTEKHKLLTNSPVPKYYEIEDSYHPHTVAYESPGCKQMLSQMKDTFDVLHSSSIVLQHLDITSYLCAPNLINTCKPHLGTVYRIFTDLSLMGVLGKHTVLYNIETHKMDPIVEAFDSETGQVCKDDQGRLKIQQVVDWPVSAGLTYGEELNKFFKWAKHLNNYHPELMDISHSKVPKGYHPLRYQTKEYDECTQSLRVFNKDERKFLKLYSLLHDKQIFVNPKDIRSGMNISEPEEEEAKQNVPYFRLQNDIIRCAEVSKLNFLIP
jgi:hypothetical protein